MDDLYKREDPLEDEGALGSCPSISARHSMVPKARFSKPKARPPSVSTTMARPFSFGSSRSKRASSKWSTLRQATDVARAFGCGGTSSAAIVAKLKRASEHDVSNGQGAGIVSAEASSSRMHTEKKIAAPWDNQELLSRRALRKDELQSRIVSLDEKIRARKAASRFKQTCEETVSPPQHTVDWDKRPSTVAMMVATPGQAGMHSEEMSPQRDSIACRAANLHKVLELPSDIELNAMDPVAALAQLQDIEEQLLRGIQGERQSVHDRIR